ncbi:MAG: glycosyltransferase family 4 protein [Candidatus Levybacteria bacterium]|nr:glycosyltransferase family 4 protein [Candidatus Levybacteria bacterium]
MKILQLSRLKFNLTPTQTASRPRMIYDLSQGLIVNGHEITVLGTGDSHLPGGNIIGVIPKAFTQLPPFENPIYAETSYLLQMVKKIEELAPQYDIIHNHTDPEFINLLATNTIKTPMLTTLHAQATKEFDDALSLFPNANFVSISQAHRKGFTKTAIKNIVYNGVDTGLYAYSEKKEDYMLWIGRLGKAKNDDGTFMDAKGVRSAIQLAEATNRRLILSGNVEDKGFYEQDIKPHLSNKIEWVGEVSSEQPLPKEEVVKLMQKAKVFLMTINWNEPFGLVMAESMSCGTPVIGFDRGAVSEVISDGKTGFVVDPNHGIDGLMTALDKIDAIDSKVCRMHVEKNFSIDSMVTNYESVYKKILQQQ